MYGFFKVRKKVHFICFKNTCNHICNALVSILESLTSSQYTVKDFLNFATETVDKISNNLIGNVDIDSFFPNIFFKETIAICTREHFKSNNIDP